MNKILSVVALLGLILAMVGSYITSGEWESLNLINLFLSIWFICANIVLVLNLGE